MNIQIQFTHFYFSLIVFQQEQKNYTMSDAVRMVVHSGLTSLEAVRATKFCVTRQALQRELERISSTEGPSLPSNVSMCSQQEVSNFTPSNTYSPQPKSSSSGSRRIVKSIPTSSKGSTAKKIPYFFKRFRVFI